MTLPKCRRAKDNVPEFLAEFRPLDATPKNAYPGLVYEVLIIVRRGLTSNEYPHAYHHKGVLFHLNVDEPLSTNTAPVISQAITLGKVAMPLYLPPSLSLEGKSAIVTGATRGIGKEVAIALASRGANIAVIYTSNGSTAAAIGLVRRFQAIGRKACSIQIDLQEADCGNRVVQAALNGLGVDTIEIIVNNAALWTPPTPSEDPLDVKSFERIMDVNVRAPMLLVAALLPHLGVKANRIINISSVNSRMNAPGFALYSASKAALESLSRTWARELAAKYRLTSNVVLVGTTDTPDAPQSEARSATAKLATAEQRLGTPDDIAEIVSWLASEGSRWVNGDAIGANGGMFMR